ncbi:hypothetical protein RRG08_061648 [Elysia crispata]|uniref:Uncharacterized protein n=1 Tax=Elysia crispata TaxID=231223 RepID=A0AAE1ARK2_9GAST|nr:hypothetical protein RRG08_061648 [Elysia crispata]
MAPPTHTHHEKKSTPLGRSPYHHADASTVDGGRADSENLGTGDKHVYSTRLISRWFLPPLLRQSRTGEKRL